MIKNTVLGRALLCQSILAIAGVTLMAAGPTDRGDTGFSGYPSLAIAMRSSAVVRPVNPNPAKLFTIFSNLGKGKNVYTHHVGWDVAGSDSGVTEEWIAMPFTPRSNAEVTQIAVAVQHDTGAPNAFVLSLNQDSGGLPGKAIHTWMVKNLPPFGTCCTLDVAKDAAGLTLRKGIQYWVVARTNSSQAKTRDEWNLASAGIEGPFAINNNDGQGWYQYTAFTSAFAVLGRKTD
jgi:hypothetical protein